VAFQFAREVARRMAEGEDKDRVRYVASKVSFAAGVERFAKSDPHFAVTSDYWDSNPYLLGTPGGTVALKTGEMFAPRPQDGISKSTSVAPSDKPDCPIFLRFLDETFSRDKLSIRFVQQFLGYSLTGDTKEQIFPFGHGGGGNGKGVLLQTVRAIFGDYAKQAAMETFVASKHEQHPTDVASLVGARLVVVSETERNQKWAEKKIQQLTGSDPVTTRAMRQDFFEFIPTFKLFIIGNHKPQLAAGVTDAMRRRLRLLPFLNKPAKADTGLVEKLVPEHPAILRWMIDGCVDWQKNGFVSCPAIDAASDEYFRGEDVFGQWIEEECDLDPGNEYKNETSADLFASFKAFLIKNGHEVSAWNSTSFGVELSKYADKEEKRKNLVARHMPQKAKTLDR
jgi:putative DNA primase/helicase